MQFKDGYNLKNCQEGIELLNLQPNVKPLSLGLKINLCEILILC